MKPLYLILVILSACDVFGGLPELGGIEVHCHYSADAGVCSGALPASDRGYVDNWTDGSGNGYNLSSSEGKRPRFIQSLYNGKPAVRFDGIDDAMTAAFPTAASAFTVFAVVDVRSNLNQYVFDGIAAGGRCYLAVGSASQPSRWMYGLGAASYSTAVTISKPAVHTIIYDTSGITHYINGNAQNVSSGSSGSLGGITLAARYSGGYACEMDIAEFVLCRGASGEGDRAAVENYLMAKYGLAKRCGDYSSGVPVADLNRDCRIDFEDIAFIASQWLSDTAPSAVNNAVYPPASPMTTEVFWQGMNDIHTFRIPSATAVNGVVLAFAEARKVSSADKTPTMLVLRRSYNGGQSWLAMQTIVDVGNDAAMDPTVVVNKNNGRVLLLFTRYPYGWNSNITAGTGMDSCTVWLTYSDDEGATWSVPANITAQVKLPQWTSYNLGPGVGLQTSAWPYSGRLIIPSGHGAVASDPASGNNHILASDDGGSTWRIQGYIATGSESQAVELADGVLLMNIRSGGILGRRISKSYNHGLTWTSPCYDAALVEPVCQGSILRLSKADAQSGKNRILFANPGSSLERKNLTVRLSYDECGSWPLAKQINRELAGYSCLVVSGNKIGVLFEAGSSYSAEKIIYTSFGLDWLTDGADRL